MHLVQPTAPNTYGKEHAGWLFASPFLQFFTGWLLFVATQGEPAQLGSIGPGLLSLPEALFCGGIELVVQEGFNGCELSLEVSRGWAVQLDLQPVDVHGRAAVLLQLLEGAHGKIVHSASDGLVREADQTAGVVLDQLNGLCLLLWAVHIAL
jgi:hypothetical protein